MDTIEWRFICIIITFAVIGIICFLKRFKSGIMAASTGVVITLGIWGIRIINMKIQVFFTDVGISFKDILIFVACIVFSIVIFFVLSALFKVKGSSKRKRRW